MPKQELHDALLKLDTALKSPGEISDADRELLEHVRGDLDKLLDANAEDPESLRDVVDEAVGRFEAEHPEMSSLMRHVLDALSRLGV